MIYALGIDEDPGFLHFLREARRQGVDVQAVNVRSAIHHGTWRFGLPDDGASFIAVDDVRVELDARASYYVRLLDLASVQSSPSEESLWKHFIVALQAWLEDAPGRVVNRPDAVVDNFAKPLHEHGLGTLGFAVPESIVSSSRSRLQEFCAAGLTIVKPVSGVRSNTRLLKPENLIDYVPVQGPVHLQRYVRGGDVRAHVVGRDVHAEIIVTEKVDYRVGGDDVHHAPHHLPACLAERIVSATGQQGLELAGWDFKVDAEGNYWCLEVNPMPGYYGYDKRADGAITRSLLRLLESDT